MVVQQLQMLSLHVNPSNYDRVVVLGPSHFEYFNGCGLTTFDKFETPFGYVDVDTSTVKNYWVILKIFSLSLKVVMFKSIQ